MKQPSLLVLFFLLFAMASAETPELLRLADNTSNDYRVGASGKESVRKNTAGKEPFLPESVPVRVRAVSYAPSQINPSRLIPAASLLVLYSVYRT